MTNNSPLLDDILNQSQSLARTVEYQCGEGRAALHEAARQLQNRSILLSGMGSSHFACHALSAELAAHGLAAAVIDTAELLHYHHGAYRDAAAVLVSRSGESIETLKVLPRLKAQGTFVVGVTDVADSPLAREADRVVMIHGGRDHLVAVQSYTATLIALQLLGAALLDRFEQAHAELSAAVEALRAFVPAMAAASAGETWRAFFEDATVIHLLGRGRSLASSHEGALLFNEVARLPSAAGEAAQFRHGPLEIVEAGFRAIVFASADHTRELNVALARDIERWGGQARLIGPGGLDRAWWTTPRVSPALAPLIEIVPVQCAALRLAEWRGIVPGEFRAATQVTRSEDGSN